MTTLYTFIFSPQEKKNRENIDFGWDRIGTSGSRKSCWRKIFAPGKKVGREHFFRRLTFWSDPENIFGPHFLTKNILRKIRQLHHLKIKKVDPPRMTILGGRKLFVTYPSYHLTWIENTTARGGIGKHFCKIRQESA